MKTEEKVKFLIIEEEKKEK